MLLIASQGEDEYRPNFPVDAQEGDGVPRNSATRGPPAPSGEEGVREMPASPTQAEVLRVAGGCRGGKVVRQELGQWGKGVTGSPTGQTRPGPQLPT